MSISSALQTGVSGLRANSKAVGSISENIANSNTVGYRRGFAHMVTTTASGGNGNLARFNWTTIYQVQNVLLWSMLAQITCPIFQ